MTRQDKKSLVSFMSHHVSESYNQAMINESFNFYPLYESFASDIDVFTKLLTSRTIYIGDLKKYILWLLAIDAVNKNTARFIERILEDYASIKIGHIDEKGEVRNMDNVVVDIAELMEENSDIYRVYVKNRDIYGQWTWGHIRSVILSGIMKSSGIMDDAENKGLFRRLSDKVLSIIKGVGRFVRYGLKHMKMKLGIRDEKYSINPISINKDGMGSYYDLSTVRKFLEQRNIDLNSRLFTLVGLCRYPNTLNPLIKLRAKERLTDLLYRSFKTDMIIAIHKFNPSKKMDEDLYRAMLVTLYYNISADFNESEVKKYIQEIADVVEALVSGVDELGNDYSKYSNWIEREDIKHSKDPFINVRNSRMNESEDETSSEKKRSSRDRKIKENPNLFWMKYTDNSYVDIPMAKWKDDRYDTTPDDSRFNDDDGDIYAEDSYFVKSYMVNKMNSKGKYKPYSSINREIQENARILINHRAQSAGVASFRRHIRELTRLMVSAGIASEFIDDGLFKTAAKTFIMFHGSKLAGYLPSAKTTSSGRDLYKLVIDGMSIRDYLEETNGLFDGIIRYNTVTHDTISGESRVVENLALQINKDRAAYIYLGALGEYLKLKYNQDILGDSLVILSKLIKEYNRIIIKPADYLADGLKYMVRGGGRRAISRMNDAFRKAFRAVGISKKPNDLSESFADDLIELADEDLTVDEFIMRLKSIKNECFTSKPLIEKGAEQIAISSMVESSLIYPSPSEFDTLVESVSSSPVAFNMAKSFGVQSIKNYLVDKFHMEYMSESVDDYVKKHVEFIIDKVNKATNITMVKKMYIGQVMWSLDYTKYVNKHEIIETYIKSAKLKFGFGRRIVREVYKGDPIRVVIVGNNSTLKDSKGHYFMAEMIGDSRHRPVRVYVTDAQKTQMRSYRFLRSASRETHEPIKVVVVDVKDSEIVCEFDALRDARMDLTSSEARQESYKKRNKWTGGNLSSSKKTSRGQLKTNLHLEKGYSVEKAYSIAYKEFEVRHREFGTKSYVGYANKFFYTDFMKFVNHYGIHHEYPMDPFIDMLVNSGRIDSDQVMFLANLTYRKKFSSRSKWTMDAMSEQAKEKIHTLASRAYLMLHQLKGDFSSINKYGFVYRTQTSKNSDHPNTRTLQYIATLLRISKEIDENGLAVNLHDVFKPYIDKPIEKLLASGGDDKSAEMIGCILAIIVGSIIRNDKLKLNDFVSYIKSKLNHINYLFPNHLPTIARSYNYKAKGDSLFPTDVKSMLNPMRIYENYSAVMTGIYRDEANDLTYMASTEHITGTKGKPHIMVADGDHMGVTDKYTVIYKDGDNWVVMKQI